MLGGDPPAAGQAIAGVQPGGGPLWRLELLWGKWRRAYLRRFRPEHVARHLALRQGECPGCVHDIIDARDLKLVRNVCGFAFAPAATRSAARGRLRIAHQGWIEVIVYGGACAALVVLALATVPWLALLPAAGLAFTLWFFRDPERVVPSGLGLVVAPADGTVDDLGEVDHHALLDGPAWRIGIFLSLLSVHVNRAPVSGRVQSLRYQRGTHHATYRVGALEHNEQMWTLVETETVPSARIAVRQIAGPAARRIVNELRVGQQVATGERFGLIKFGSRTELYLPRLPGWTLEVALGTKVRAGSTVVARWRSRPARSSSYGHA